MLNININSVSFATGTQGAEGYGLWPSAPLLPPTSSVAVGVVYQIVVLLLVQVPSFCAKFLN